MITQSVIHELAYLNRRLNSLVDALIPMRDNTSGSDKAYLRIVTRKVEGALGKINEAQDRIDEEMNDV